MSHDSSVSESPKHDVSSPVLYVVVFIALIILTLVTAACSRLPLGAWEAPVALTIAATKAALVTLFFMHLIHMRKLNWVIVAAGLFWLSIAGVLTMADYMTRTWYSTIASPASAIDNLSKVERRSEKDRPTATNVLPGGEVR